MHFVDAEWRAKRVLFAAFLQPGVISPLELTIIPNNGSVLRRRLEEGAIGVSLEDNRSVDIFDLVFVKRALSQAGDEQFPNPGRTESAHRVIAAIPSIEIANDTDPLCIGCPNGKACSSGAIDYPKLRPELIVNSLLFALTKQVEVCFAESREERIRIASATDDSLAVSDD